MTHYTWDNIVGYINSVLSTESSDTNRSFFELLANQALREISEQALLYELSWDNDSGGDLSISDNVVTLPIDLIKVTRVEWDGTANPLTMLSIDALDKDYNGWRESAGDPTAYSMLDAHTLILSSIPSGTTTGKLVVRGKAYLPDFSSVPGAQNPLEYIPAGSQLAPGDYVIWKTPVVPCEPINDSREAILHATTETQRRLQVREDHKNYYMQSLANLVSNVNKRTRKAWSY